jgi:hypothetical protein
MVPVYRRCHVPRLLRATGAALAIGSNVSPRSVFQTRGSESRTCRHHKGRSSSTVISNTVVPRTPAPLLTFEDSDPPFKTATPVWRQKGTSTTGDKSDAGTIGDVLAVATQSGELALAAGEVVARRMSLGVAAALYPLQADHVEFARIVPEKVEAFSAAGMIILKRSEQARRQMTRAASDEIMTTAHATIAMAGCSNPAALVAAQFRSRSRGLIGRLRTSSRWECSR